MSRMDYISSVNICYLICDTLCLIDKRPIEHGMRVAYMLMRMLECKGSYDEYEAAEFVFLAMLHDIGAYKTDRLTDTLSHDEPESSGRHSAYGALFLKNTSPFGNRCDIITYHHLPYHKLNLINYEYNRIAMYLSLLEDVDACYRKDGEKVDFRQFENEAGEKYMPEAVMLLLKCARKDNMLKQIGSGAYKEELRKYMDYVIFTNEEKENYLKFIVHCYSLKMKMQTIETIVCCCVVDEIAEVLGLTGREKDKLDYGTMLHDIGMLAIDSDILKAPRELTEDEITEVRRHVEIGDELLKKYFAVQEITEIAAAHHEHLDGTGYPHGLREKQMTQPQFTLQVADRITAMMNKRGYRQALSWREIKDTLMKQALGRHLNEQIVQTAINRFDAIEKRVRSEMKEFLEMHVHINNQYKIMVDSNLREED